jgi:hypothetical protein
MLLKMQKKSINSLYLFFLFFTFPIFSDSIELDVKTTIALAMENTLNLKLQEAQLQLGYKGYKLELRQFLPQLTFNLSGNQSVSETSTDSYSKQLGISLSQPVFNGGRTWSRRTLSRIQLYINEQELQAEKKKIQDHIWQLYFSSAMIIERLKLQIKSLVITKTQLKVIELQSQQGVITGLNKLEAEIQVSNLDLSVRKSRIELKQKFFELSLALDFPIDTTYTFEEADFIGYTGIVNLPPLDLLYDTLLASNLDLKKLRVQINQKNEEMNLLKFKYLPNITLEANYSVSGDDFPLYSDQFTIGLKFSMNNIDSPISFSYQEGQKGEFSYIRSENISITPLKALSTELQKDSLLIEMNGHKRKENEMCQQLYFLLENQLEFYVLLREQLVQERRNLDLFKQKNLVMEQELKIGQIKQSNLLSSYIEEAEKELELLSSIMELKSQEWMIEKNVGLSPNSLGCMGEQ